MTDSDRKITTGSLPSDALAWLSAASSDPPRWRVRYRLGGRPGYTLPAGVKWDAVAFGWRTGVDVVERLLAAGAHVGPVVGRRHVRVVVLIPLGTADQVAGIGCAHGHGSVIAVPGPAGPTDLCWLVPPTGAPALTDPADLVRAWTAHSAV